MESLRKRNVKNILHKHLSNKGLIVGVSAGAIALTPCIETAAMCGDANLGALENSVGLGLVNLGFLPHLGKHYVHTLESEARIKELATRLGMRICIATDSDGLFVDGSDVQPFGNIITVAP